MPAAVGAAEHGAVGLCGIDPPDGEAQQFAEAAGEARLAAARFADQQQRAQLDDGPVNKIGEGKVDDLGGLGEFADQRAADPIECGGLDQGKRDVEDIPDRFDDALEFCASGLGVVDPPDDDMVRPERAGGR
jgi:hypothetical protein